MIKLTTKVSGPQDLVVPFKCPNCQHEHKVNARRTAPGTVIKCGCGANLEITGDDLRKIQRALDGVRRAFENFGR